MQSAPVAEVLRLVGLQRVSGRRARELPAGMRRRLALAAALVGDPEVLILDEPDEGLDPEGVQWLQSLLRGFADDGRTVLVACRGSDEIEDIADEVLVMDRGRLLTRSSPDELTGAQAEVVVSSPGAEVLAEELRNAGIEPFSVSGDELRVRDVPPRVVSELATAAGVPVWEIREEEPSLEQAVVDLSRGASSNGAEDRDEPRAERGSEDGGGGEDRAERGGGEDREDRGGGEDRAESGGGEDHEDRGGGEDRAERGGSESRDEAQPNGDGERRAAPDDRDEAEQALDAELRELPRLEGSNVVAVLAPAAGLGRTSLAYLVADVLANCADVDTLAVALSCDHDRLAMTVDEDDRTSLHLGDLLGDLPEFDEAAHISPYVSQAGSGAHVLGGPPEPEDLARLEPQQIEALLDFAGRFYGLVVVDVGELSEPSLHLVVRRADRVLLLGAPGAVDDLDEGSAVLDAIESERSDRAILVFNRVDEERVRAFAHGDQGASQHVLVPQDRDLIRALDAGGFDLADVRAPVRVALKRLALTVAEELR